MKFSRLFLYMSFLCIAACGGGGGSGGAGLDDTFNPPADTATPILYNGVQSQAALTPTDMESFVFGLLGDMESDTWGNVNTASSRISLTANFGTKSRKEAGSVADGGYRIAAQSTDSEPCDTGSVDHYADIMPDGTGTLTVDNNNCVMDGILTDGLFILKILAYDPSRAIITRGVMTFNRLTISGGGMNTINSGSIEFQKLPDGRERETINIVFEESNSGRKIRLENIVIETQYGASHFGFQDFTKSFSGRLYGSAHGYIDVTTLVPVKYRSDFPDVPLDGVLKFSGANASAALLRFLGGHNLLVRLDSDGDGGYEKTATMNMTRLTQGENADIADDDGDGMHNSWEIRFGLDPQDAADGSQDADGDMGSNREEYYAGTMPDNPLSAAPQVDLGLERGFAEEPRFPAGMSSWLRINVFNHVPHSDEEMDFVHVRIAMPEIFVLQSVSEECEVEGNIVTCFFQEKFYNASLIAINFIPPATTGDYNFSAIVYSTSSFDPEESNNVINGQLEIGPATAELTASFVHPAVPVPTIGTLLYSFEIENTGILPASDVRADLELPAGVVVNGTTWDSMCDLNGQELNCALGDMMSGSRWEITVLATPPSTLGPITAALSVTSDTPELNLADSAAELTNEIITPISDMHFLNSASRPLAFVNTQWSVSISPSTAGPHALPETQVAIDLPEGVDFVSYSGLAAAAECQGEDLIECTLPSTGSGSYDSFSLILTSATPGIYDFPVTVTTTGDDPDLSNNTMMVSAFIGQSTGPIEQLIAAAPDGATVEVPAGYYFGDLVYDGRNIDLVAVDGPEHTFVASTFIGIGIHNAPGGSISGFTFTHSRTEAVWLFNSDVTVHGNVFEYIDGGFASAIFINGDETSAVIERNIMRNSLCSSTWRGVITLTGQGDPVIRNNTFVNNDCAGVYMSTLTASPAVIVNNTFAGNDAGVVVSAQARNAGAYVGNNIFAGNGVGIETETDCGADCSMFRSNLLHDNGLDYMDSPDQAGMNGNLSADPLFTDAANEDFSLQSGSPAIDAGAGLHAPADDFAGNPRPVDGDASGGAQHDIGAFEFQ